MNSSANESAPSASQTVVELPKLEGGKRRLILSEDQFFLVLATIIGTISGLLVVCFQLSIDWFQAHLLGPAPPYPPSRVVLAPTLVGLLVAFLVIRVFPRVRGSGVNQTKAAAYIYDGYIPFRTVIGKFILCALAIGSGQSLGPEDPSLQIGAGIASALGRRLRLSRRKLRLIAPVGAAAGLAAAFNSPIAAVLFVIEEVIGRWNAGVLGAIVLAVASSVVVERGFRGSQPLFHIPVYNPKHNSTLLAYVVLGVVGGLTSLMFVKLIAFLRQRLKALPRSTQYFQPAVAGLIIGIIGLRFPEVLGAGYEAMGHAINLQYVWHTLALLAALKIIATTLSFTSGTPGGMFAPTLFIGAMLGGTVGALEHHFFPELAGSLGPYALVGMGTLFAGFLRAPMTSVFMVLELSGNYSIILPVMVSNTIAYLISFKYQRVPLFDILSRQDGVELPSMEEEREQAALSVEDAMHSEDYIVLTGEDSVDTALRRAKGKSDRFKLVRYGNGMWTGIQADTLQMLADGEKAGLPLEEVYTNPYMPVLHPDQPLSLALSKLGNWPFLPVVSRADFRKLEGVISLDDVLHAFRNSKTES